MPCFIRVPSLIRNLEHEPCKPGSLIHETTRVQHQHLAQLIHLFLYTCLANNIGHNSNICIQIAWHLHWNKLTFRIRINKRIRWPSRMYVEECPALWCRGAMYKLRSLNHVALAVPSTGIFARSTNRRASVNSRRNSFSKCNITGTEYNYVVFVFAPAYDS